MRPDSAFPGQTPAPEQLCAYVDGELDEATRQAVEAWLAGHPNAAAEVEAQRRLADLWHEGGPPEIDGAGADAVLQRIERALLGRTARSARRRRAALRLAVAGIAAAVLLVVWTRRPPVELDQRPAPSREVVEEFPVVAPGDVQILRLRKDHDAGFVGAEPLVDQPLALATPRDVTLVNLAPDDGGNIPVLARDRDPNAPALVRPFELVTFSFP